MSSLVFLLCALPLVAHPPQNLMKVGFELKKDSLFCTAEVHYGELYSLQRKQGGEVSSKDFPSIVRSFHMNCPVKIDGVLIEPQLVSFDRPGKAWGMHYLDHALPDEEIRIARIVLKYDCPDVPEQVAVSWQLIPRAMDRLEIPFVHGDTTVMFPVSHGQSDLTWQPDSEAANKHESSFGPAQREVSRSRGVSPDDTSLEAGSSSSDEKAVHAIPYAAGVSGVIILLALGLWILRPRRKS